MESLFCPLIGRPVSSFVPPTKAPCPRESTQDSFEGRHAATLDALNSATLSLPRPHAAPKPTYPWVGSRGVIAPSLRGLFALLHDTDKPDHDTLTQWLFLNAKEALTPEACGAMEEVATEVMDSVRRAATTVTLRDHNVPLLHPFCHDATEGVAHYLQVLERDGAFGCGVEARAIAEALGARVVVFRDDAPTGHLVPMKVAYGPADSPSRLWIMHDGASHWQAVRRPEGVAEAAPLGVFDKRARNGGGGNCLFHALFQALCICDDPFSLLDKVPVDAAYGKLVPNLKDALNSGFGGSGHKVLRVMAVQYMRDHVEHFADDVRLEADQARSRLQPRAVRAVDARAVRLAASKLAPQSWSMALGHVIEHHDTVTLLVGDTDKPRWGEPQKRNPRTQVVALLQDMLNKVAQATLDGRLAPAAFIEELDALCKRYGKNPERVLSAWPYGMRYVLYHALGGRDGAQTVQEAHAKFGSIFSVLSFKNQQQILEPDEFGQLFAIEKHAAIIDLVDKLNVELAFCLRQGSHAQHVGEFCLRNASDAKGVGDVHTFGAMWQEASVQEPLKLLIRRLAASPTFSGQAAALRALMVWLSCAQEPVIDQVLGELTASQGTMQVVRNAMQAGLPAPGQERSPEAARLAHVLRKCPPTMRMSIGLPSCPP